MIRLPFSLNKKSPAGWDPAGKIHIQGQCPDGRSVVLYGREEAVGDVDDDLRGAVDAEGGTVDHEIMGIGGAPAFAGVVVEVIAALLVDLVHHLLGFRAFLISFSVMMFVSLLQLNQIN